MPPAELQRRRQDTKLEMAPGLCRSFLGGRSGDEATSLMAVSVDGLSDREFAEAGPVATIQDRWHRKNRSTGKLERTALYGKGKRYRPHFRDASGREVTKAFDRKVDAQRWLDERTAELCGDPRRSSRSKMTVGEWSELDGRARAPQAEDAACYRVVAAKRASCRPGDVSRSRGSATGRRRVGRGDAHRGAVGVPDAAGVPPVRVDAGRRGARQAAGARTRPRGSIFRDCRGRSADTSTTGSSPSSPTTCGPYRLLVLVLGYTGLRWGEATGAAGAARGPRSADGSRSSRR